VSAAEDESQPVHQHASVQQKLAALLSEDVAGLDPGYKIWGATFFAITLIIVAALLAVFAVTR